MAPNTPSKSLFQCPKCKKIMVKPIYQCPSGHSICSDCKPKLKTCVTCPESLETRTARNYTLETIVDVIKLKCENAGCKEMIFLNQYDDHLSVCPYSLIQCPVQSCIRYITIDRLAQHARDKHKAQFVDSNESQINTNVLGVFLTCRGQLFYVGRKFHTSICVTWQAQLVSSRSTDKKYLFTLRTIHNGSTVILREPCLKLVPKGQSVSEPLLYMDYTASMNYEIFVAIEEDKSIKTLDKPAENDQEKQQVASNETCRV